jgi:hypothetical protein
MNYQSVAIYDDALPQNFYGSEGKAFDNNGAGLAHTNLNNLTVENMYLDSYLFTNDHRKDFWGLQNIALEGIQSGSELSKLYFSDVNIKRVDRALRREVFKRTRGQFSVDIEQDKYDLFILMRAVYMQNARFLPDTSDLVRQCKRLNDMVITASISDVITNLKQDYGYLKEINKPLSPIPRPLDVNSRGRRSLPSVFTTFGS